MKEKFYLTTAIHYANAAPHLGHAYEDILADIIARYKRERGFDTFFLTGMDEHGSKNLRTAKEKGMGPQAFVDKNAKNFRDLFDSLRISYDEFIRTSDKEKHWPGAISLWKAMDAKGDIYKKKYRGLYCVGCEEFKTEKDLIDGKCPEHDKAPEVVEEENYFFKASKYGEEVLKRIESGMLKITPVGRKNEIISFLKEGLEDVSFSRSEKDIPWGIPVPGDPTHMMYVWCDALTNYISALGYGRNDELFKKYWPADIHIVGKGIFRFHAALWPAMLLSAGLPLPKEIFVHGYITSQGKKMSKSIGNVVDPADVLARYGGEPLRYFLASEISPFEDGDFTEEKFVERYNADLANGIGNLVSRVLKMSSLYFSGVVTGGHKELAPIRGHVDTVSDEHTRDIGLLEELIAEPFSPEYERAMDSFDIHRAMGVVKKLAKTLDTYVADYEPFKLVKTDKNKAEGVLFNLLYGISTLARLVSPVLPDTAKKIRALITEEAGTYRTTEPKEPLFPRIGI